MAKISNKEVYVEDHNVTIDDYLIGTDSANPKKLQTKTFPVQSLVELVESNLEEKIPRRTSQLINDGEDGVNKFITEKEVIGKNYQFSNLEEVIIEHNLNRIVNVTVIINSIKIEPEVEYMDDLNTVIVRHGRPETGIINIK